MRPTNRAGNSHGPDLLMLPTSCRVRASTSRRRPERWKTSFSAPLFERTSPQRLAARPVAAPENGFPYMTRSRRIVAEADSSGTARRPESMQPECSNAGSKTPGCQMRSLPILLGLPESRFSWRMEEHLKWCNKSPATPTVGRQSFTTAAVRRFCSRIWRGFGTDSNLK